jgi:hypothetical protein
VRTTCSCEEGKAEEKREKKERKEKKETGHEKGLFHSRLLHPVFRSPTDNKL